jgi:hypothetical protein
MKPIDLKDLVTGLLIIIGLALTIGQYDRLQEFAKIEAAHALKGWNSHPFFPAGYKMEHR